MGTLRTTRRRSRILSAIVACLLLAPLVGAALATRAAADDIPQLVGQITDRTNAQVLSSGRQRIQPVLDELVRTDDIQLFVLFVETTAARTVTAFADETAGANSLGGNDALLVVAMTDRSDAIWRSSSYLDRLTDRELQTVLSQQVEPLLRDGDYAGAAIAAAYGLRSASRTNEGVAPAPAPAPSASLPDLGFVVPLILIVVGAVVLWSVLASRRRERAALAARAAQDAQRATEANAALIRADESLRDAQQEMGYAEAQFSAEEIAPYRAAVGAAEVELKAAFTLRQQLDDAVPDTEDARRQMVEGIVTHATKALALLDEQRKRVEEMRELERRAPELLAALHQQVSDIAARLPGAERTIAGFARYAEQSWSSVKSNASDARDLVSRASAHVSEGEAASQQGDAAGAAKGVREAQQDLTEAMRLLDAIESVAAAISEAQRTARDHVAAASSDIEKATALARAHAEPEHEQRLATARAAMASAESALASPTPDFLAAVKLAVEAGSGATAVLAELRQEEERRAGEARALAAQLQIARDAGRRAADYIAPRRRTIGATARTRLAEAERHLADAEQAAGGGDAAAALREAQHAQRLADEAWSLARDDVRDAEGQGPWTGFPRAPVIIPFPFPIGGSHGPVGGGWRPPISIPRPGGGSVGGRW